MANRAVLLGLTLVAASLLAPATGSAARGDDDTARYFRGLRERKLFGLAEGYCLHRLAQPKLSPSEAALLTIELSSTLAEHAAEAREDEQAELWSRARAVVSDFLRNHPQSPQRLALEVQGAQVVAAQGEWLRWQVELVPEQGELRPQAQTVLAQAVELLRALQPRVAAAARRTGGERDGAGSGTTPDPIDYGGLVLQVRFRLAVSLLNLATVLPAQDANRSAHLIDAEKLLRGLGGDAADPDWGMRLLAVQCSRLQGDLARTRRELDALDALAPPPEVQPRLLAERVRVLLAEKKPVEARRVLEQHFTTAEALPESFELRFLHVQVLNNLWQQAAQLRNAAADLLWTELRAALTELDQPQAGYWGARAALIRQQMADLESYGAELAPLVRAAETDYRAGRIDEAIEKYGRAATQAHRSNRPDLAFRFGFTRASIQQQAADWSGAAAGFQDLAKQFPENPQAADASLLGAFGLGRLYAEKQTRGRRLAYSTALEDHRRVFPDSPTAVEATWMLAQLEDRREQFGQAIGLYRQIPQEHPRGMPARVAEASCFRKIIERLEPGQTREAWEQASVERLTQILQDLPEPPDPEQGWTGERAELALELSARLLNRPRPDFAAAEGWLSRISVAKPAATGDESTEASAAERGRLASAQELPARVARLRIVSLAGQGRPQEARALLDHLSATDPVELLRILEGLDPLAAAATPGITRDLGELQLAAAERLQAQRGGLSAADQRRLDLCRARALAATRQPRKALEVYEQLLAATPRDKPVLTAAARLQMECGTKECLARGLAHWRTLEGLEKGGTPEWLAYRYEICHTLLLQGDVAECRKLLKITQLLYPQLGTAELRQKYADLTRRVNAARAQ